MEKSNQCNLPLTDLILGILLPFPDAFTQSGELCLCEEQLHLYLRYKRLLCHAKKMLGTVTSPCTMEWEQTTKPGLWTGL